MIKAHGKSLVPKSRGYGEIQPLHLLHYSEGSYPAAGFRRSRSKLPPGFRELVNQMVKVILLTRPVCLYRFFANYLEAELNKRTLFEVQCALESYHPPPGGLFEYLPQRIHEMCRKDELCQEIQSAKREFQKVKKKKIRRKGHCETVKKPVMKCRRVADLMAKCASVGSDCSDDRSCGEPGSESDRSGKCCGKDFIRPLNRDKHYGYSVAPASNCGQSTLDCSPEKESEYPARDQQLNSHDLDGIHITIPSADIGLMQNPNVNLVLRSLMAGSGDMASLEDHDRMSDYSSHLLNERWASELVKVALQCLGSSSDWVLGLKSDHDDDPSDFPATSAIDRLSITGSADEEPSEHPSPSPIDVLEDAEEEPTDIPEPSQIDTMNDRDSVDNETEISVWNADDVVDSVSNPFLHYISDHGGEYKDSASRVEQLKDVSDLPQEPALEEEEEAEEVDEDLIEMTSNYSDVTQSNLGADHPDKPPSFHLK